MNVCSISTEWGVNRTVQLLHLPFHQLSSSEVGSHRLVVFTLHRKRVTVGDPRRTVGPLQSGGLAVRARVNSYSGTRTPEGCTACVCVCV